LTQSFELQVFVRELASNAADALEKLRYLSLKNPEDYPSGADELAIRIKVDKDNKTLIIEVLL
jgi:HSP90 family molecular chaperone